MLFGVALCGAWVFTLIEFGASGRPARQLLGGLGPLQLRLSPWLAALAAGWLLWTARAPERAHVHRRAAGAALGVAVLLAMLAVLGSSLARHPRLHDVGDNYHYYLGTRYFSELDYDRLYECSAVALDELGRSVPRRMRDLTTNRHVPVVVDEALRTRCHAAFSPIRWERFKQDVRFYRNRHSFERFARRFTDHGYNGTPFWTAVSGAISTRLAVTDANQSGLAFLNVVLLGGMAAVLLQCLGIELGLCLLLLTLLSYPDQLVLVGAHLRYLWIALLASGLSLLGRGRHASAAVLIGLASGLLIFPAVFLAGTGAKLALAIARRERPPAELVRFSLAAALTLAAVFGLSLLQGRGLEAWAGFLDQMELNAGRMATGRIGFVI